MHKINEKDIKSTIEYKGYIGTVEIDDDGKGFSGKVLSINDEHSIYYADNYDEFIKMFHEAVDDYIEDKKKKNQEVEKQFKGSFNVRLKPEVHRDAVMFAKKHNISMSKLVSIALKEKIYG